MFAVTLYCYAIMEIYCHLPIRRPILKAFTLRQLLISTILCTLLSITIISVSSSYFMQKETLIENTLERHFAYSQKLATSAELSIEDAQKMLAESAQALAQNFANENALSQETNRLLNQSSTFNSISIINAEGVVVAVSPPMYDIIGQVVTSKSAQEAIRTKVPTISEPYEAMTGRLIIMLTYPIFDDKDTYLGAINGAIYLREPNIFSSLMQTHFSQDQSYVFVVDENGTIIYHENQKRINDNVAENNVVEEVLQRESGAMEVTNSKGQRMLAGYSFVEGANWGVISQRPLDVTVLPAQETVLRNSLLTLPFIAIIVALYIFFATKIAKPMYDLTELTKQNAEHHGLAQLQDVNGWYHEANQLKQTLITSFTALQSEVNVLKTEATHDALTNLLNRRAVVTTLKSWDAAKMSYTIILFDIDKFKIVNDTYGHQVGDDVLVYFANKMRAHTMPYHLCCRYGGEEFIILLPNATIEQATTLANTLREDLTITVSPTGQPITVSGGVAASNTTQRYKEVIEAADEALYAAKTSGRNQICTIEHTHV